MKKKEFLTVLVATLTIVVAFGFVWRYKNSQETARKVVLKGYVDSVSRWAYQQIITAYIGGESYPNFFYFYVGDENKPLEFDGPETIALVTKEGRFVSESVYGRKVTISGMMGDGKVCYWVGKARKEDSEGAEKCHEMPVVIVEDILDQEGSSLVLTRLSE